LCGGPCGTHSVCITNDERAKLQKEINLATGSGIIEEKSYEEYD